MGSAALLFVEQIHSRRIDHYGHTSEGCHLRDNQLKMTHWAFVFYPLPDIFTQWTFHQLQPPPCDSQKHSLISISLSQVVVLQLS